MKINTRVIGVEPHFLLDGGIQCLPLADEDREELPIGDDSPGGDLPNGIFVLLEVIGDVPRAEFVSGVILEELKDVAGGREYLAVVDFIVNAR